MSRLDCGDGSGLDGFPRVSGDEPTIVIRIGNQAQFSPCERG